MPRMVVPIVKRGDKVREGRGFSKGELKEAGLSPSEAMRLGIPVDKRRRTVHEENVRRLKEYLEEAEKTGIRFKKPKQTAKPKRGRVFRGLTSAGKKMRGLRKRGP